MKNKIFVWKGIAKYILYKTFFLIIRNSSFRRLVFTILKFPKKFTRNVHFLIYVILLQIKKRLQEKRNQPNKYAEKQSQTLTVALAVISRPISIFVVPVLRIERSKSNSTE